MKMTTKTAALTLLTLLSICYLNQLVYLKLNDSIKPFFWLSLSSYTVLPITLIADGTQNTILIGIAPIATSLYEDM